MRAVVVSGSSTGIGNDTAMALAQSGFFVFAGVRKTSDFKIFENKKQIVPVLLDVASPTSVLSAKKFIESEIEALGIRIHEWNLVNNAGIVVSGPIEGLTDQQWQSQFDVNVLGLLRLTREFLPLIRQTKGYIINIGSISGIVSTPFLGPYCASKFAVESISDCLRREVGEFGVKVVLVQPGPIQTPIWSKNLSEKENTVRGFSPEVRKVYGSLIQRVEKMVEMSARRAVPVSAVSGAILKILSLSKPKARWLVGAPEVKLQVSLFRVLSDRLGDKLMSIGAGR